MKHLSQLILLILLLILIPLREMGIAHPPLLEPSMKEKIGWNLKGNGLLYVSYDLDHNGKADYHTIHFVIKTYLTGEPLSALSGYYQGVQVFYVNYGPANQIYVISGKALFYAFDVNEDGNWDLMYKDVEEDGINGNEAFYDSPSNMFTASSSLSQD